MRIQCLALSLLLLFAGAATASAQGGEDESYTCWQCPACGTVFSLSPYEAENTAPYSICPACGMAYAMYFAQVPCPDSAYEDNYEDYYDDYEEEANQYTTLNQEPDSQGPSNVSSLEALPLAGLKTAPDELVSESQTLPSKGKILMVVPQQDYQEDELNIPRNHFQRSGYDVVLASKGVKTATGMEGGNISIDLDLQDANVSEYKAVVFVGGEGIYYLNLNEDASYQALAKDAAAQNKLLGAICLAPWTLADADLLTGKKATASDTDHLKSKGAVISDQPVVRDANIITANGPSAAQEFAEAIIAALEESGSSKEGLSQEDLAGALRIPLGTEEVTSQDQQPASLPKYKCTNCAYVYDPAQGDPDSGIEPGTPFERLPADWKCPWCGGEKSKFVRA